MASILVIAAPGGEEIELITVADIMVRAGHDVTIAATGSDTRYHGSRQLPMAADTTLDAVIDTSFDVLYLPGGGGSAETCRDDPRIQDLMERQLAAGRLLAIICASSIALVPRKLAAERRVTSYPAKRPDVEPAVGEWVDERVVVDGNLITSQGPGTAMELALTLVDRLDGPEAAADVAAALLTPWPR